MSERAPSGAPRRAQIYSIGHSTRSEQEFIELLQLHGIATLADVRTIPRSRHNPQFNREQLSRAAHRAGIQYVHLARLGGLRKSVGESSPNKGWRNASFRGYADYMLTDEFERGLAELLKLAKEGLVTMMCAEAVPWRCHRSLVSDALLVRGVPVLHITGRSAPSLHKLTPFAAVNDGRLTYPGPPNRATRMETGNALKEPTPPVAAE